VTDTWPDITIPELLGCAYRRGEPVLRDALAKLISLKRWPCSYERLKEFAAELRETGLLDCAGIVDEVAETAPHEWDIKHPYPDDCGSQIKEWKAEMALKKQAWEAMRSASDTAGQVGRGKILELRQEGNGAKGNGSGG